MAFFCESGTSKYQDKLRPALNPPKITIPDLAKSETKTPTRTDEGKFPTGHGGGADYESGTEAE